LVDLPTIAEPVPEMSPEERRKAWLKLWLQDHGFIRDIYWNLHQVSDKVWRAAQPGPRQLQKAKDMGIKTILNLRGRRDHCGIYKLERETCHKLGLTLIDFPIRSRSPLDTPTLKAAAELFDGLEYPMLLHCKSGADRAGFMSTLYMFLYEQKPLYEAMGQLSLKYGHVKQAKTGVLDFFFETFSKETDGRQESFLPWVENQYDRDKLDASFKEGWVAGVLVNKILRRE